jgi:NADP-dependent 3-hydroxy acid dehydrogenase YdfG
MDKQKVILINGASSGIGQAIAQRLAQNGNLVFGTSRSPAKADMSQAYKVLTLDVDSDASGKEFVGTVLEQTGHVDVLINNAGYALSGVLGDTK